ncbi:major facilitator superfamily domain-containing protein [Aspergillus cavernicola]|uniref:Major facilitator superfamily domain-containing protein n=1 Tax=Aspergillus cavernicola TaxID=176166 RepID=A0ABR4J0Z3_9EURO
MKDPPHDKALDLLRSQLVDFDQDSEEAKWVLRKIDCIVLPLLCLIYTIMLMDKSSLSFAGIMGIKEDCKLTGSEYSWLGSIMYFGYLVGDVPAIILLQRFPIDKTFPIVVMIWGIVVALHAACRQFASLAVLRFILGFGEVFTGPVVIQVLASWYTKREQLTRLPIWYMCYGFAYIGGGFLAWCIYQADRFRWQSFFILFGGITFLLGFVLYFYLPASPTTARWLTAREKAIGLERVRGNKTGTEVWKFNGSQLKEAFLDPRMYIIFLLLVSMGLHSGGIAVFVPNCNPFLMAMMTAGASGSTKKFAFSASYQLGYAVGNIIGPQTFSAKDGPEYYPAKYTMLAFFVFGTLLFLSMGALHLVWNKQRERKEAQDAQDGIVHEVIENEEFLDKTDVNIKSFVYPL